MANRHPIQSLALLKTLMTVTLSLHLLGGCATASRPAFSPDITLVTHISDDASKRFSLTVSQPEPASSNRGAGKGGRSAMGGRGGGKGGGMGRSGRGGGSTEPASSARGDKKQQRREQLIETLDKELATIQYCRQGYTLTEEFIGRGVAKLSGECSEPASDADRKRFPNQAKGNKNSTTLGLRIDPSL